MFTICFSLHKRRFWGDARDMRRERKAKITPVVIVRCLSSTKTSTTNDERSSVKNWEDHTLDFQSKVVKNYLWQLVNRFLANSFPSREELSTNRALARQMMSKTVEDNRHEKMIYLVPIADHSRVQERSPRANNVCCSRHDGDNNQNVCVCAYYDLTVYVVF